MVSVVVSTAAGDAFVGRLAVAIGEGKVLFAAAQFANVAGTLAVICHSVQPVIPSRY